MLPKINRMLSNFHESSSNCPSMVVSFVRSMLSLQSRNNLHKKKPKVRTNMLNKGIRVKMKR